MDSSSYDYELSYVRNPTQQPNPTRTQFDFFKIKLNYTHLFHADHRELTNATLRTACFPRRLVLSEDEDTLNSLSSFLASISQDEVFLGELMLDVFTFASP